MVCEKCGNQLPKGSLRCNACGALVPREKEAGMDPKKKKLFLLAAAGAMVFLVTLGVLLGYLLGKNNTTTQVYFSSGPSGLNADNAGVVAAPTPIPDPDPNTVVVQSPTPPPATPAPAPDAVKVFYFEKELTEFTEPVGSELTVKAVAYPVELFGGSDTTFKWSVSDESIVSLKVSDDTKSCTVKILQTKPGGVILTVECNGVKTEVKVYTKN